MQWADSRKPREMIRRALRDPKFQRSFHALKNVRPRAIYSAFDSWAKRRDMTGYTREALKQQMDIRRADEFKHAVGLCTHWLVNHNLQRYAMIIEITQTTAKSSTWLAGPVITGLQKLGVPGPTVIIPFVDGRYLSVKAVKEAIDTGITTFVHVDDAVYSGSQKGIMVRQLTSALRAAHVKRARALIAVPYTTDLGRRYVSRLAARPLKLHFYAPHIIKTRTLPWVSRVELMLRGNKNIRSGGPAMTILPHKMPNSVSFGPASLSYALQTRIPQPVYKKFSF
jgi:hypothetical protein